MRHYRCSCDNVLFFENTRCLQCEREVGYEPEEDRMVPLEAGCGWGRCANGLTHGVCNWLVPEGSAGALCPACRLNRTIPDASLPENVTAWSRVEVAKRRLLYTLASFGLRPRPKSDDSKGGLAFDLLRPLPGAPVLTGHADGFITINIDEAEDSVRERQRELMGEQWRTLIGHFRHESAHYYWDRFFIGRADDDPYLAGFREVFGDERIDYQAELRRRYAEGAPSADPQEYISAYASVHPWEDWAEIWAHHLHLTDGVETAAYFGFSSRAVPLPFTPFPATVSELPGELKWRKGEGRRFLSTLHDWAKLGPAINELGASLGHPALFPFVYSEVTVRKLCFVHFVIESLGPELTRE